MPRPARYSLLLALVPGLIAAPALRAQSSDPDVEAVRTVVTSLARNAQAGNLDAMGALFAPGRGVHIIEGAGVNHGWADYREHHLEPELSEFQNFRYRYFAIEPTVRGDAAWASFRYDLSTDTPSGHVEAEGRGTAVLERRDGRWLVVHLHTSGRRKS